jgi:hypothetical protein
MIDAISQLWVSIFGLTALLCMVSKPIRARRAGVILGLIGQPGWYAQLVIHEQWGMLPVFAGYTAVWLIGLFTLWIRPTNAPHTPETIRPVNNIEREVIAIIGTNTMSGREIRQAMKARGHHRTKAAAYLLLANMVDSGLLQHDWENWVENGETYRQKVFKLAPIRQAVPR